MVGSYLARWVGTCTYIIWDHSNFLEPTVILFMRINVGDINVKSPCIKFNVGHVQFSFLLVREYCGVIILLVLFMSCDYTILYIYVSSVTNSNCFAQ